MREGRSELGTEQERKRENNKGVKVEGKMKYELTYFIFNPLSIIYFSGIKCKLSFSMSFIINPVALTTTNQITVTSHMITLTNRISENLQYTWNYPAIP